jgi:hypothetical protein
MDDKALTAAILKGIQEAKKDILNTNKVVGELARGLSGLSNIEGSTFEFEVKSQPDGAVRITTNVVEEYSATHPLSISVRNTGFIQMGLAAQCDSRKVKDVLREVAKQATKRGMIP